MIATKRRPAEASSGAENIVFRNTGSPGRTVSVLRQTTGIILLTIAGLVLGYALQALPLVPSWRVTQIIALMAVAVVLTLAIPWKAMVAWRSGARWLALVTGLCALASAWVVLWLFLLEIAPTGSLRGKELVGEFQEQGDSRDILFVYEESDIPDGFIRTTIKVRRGPLPVQHTLLEIEKPFGGATVTPLGIELHFGNLNEVRYLYFNGHLHPAMVPGRTGSPGPSSSILKASSALCPQINLIRPVHHGGDSLRTGAEDKNTVVGGTELG